MFLKDIAHLFYREYGKGIGRLAFVFPSQRAGLFFKKYLSEEADSPFFSPATLTVTDLFLQLSEKRVADRISMLFSLYKIYVTLSQSTESFDNFLYWGEMLLNDFDDIDKYRVDAGRLFRNVTDLREIENDFSFLNEKQMAAIRTFWSSFYLKKSSGQQDFLEIWQLLYALYDEFKAKLASEGKGYEGMIFRDVIENINEEKCRSLGYEKIVFVGLNALSVVEKELLEQLHRMKLADFYWDYSSVKVKDPDNKASYFVEQNAKLFPSFYSLPMEHRADPKIEVVGIPSGIGQAKYLHTILQNMIAEGALASGDDLRTAIVLPDEFLLMPVLHSIPEQITHINVTMGYPLSGTPIASLVDMILSLQRNVRYAQGLPLFYFRDVLAILNHRYISFESSTDLTSLIEYITKKNRIYVEQEELKKSSLLSLIFSPVNDVVQLPDYLIAILEAVNRHLSTDRLEEEERIGHPMDSEYIFHYYTTINRMKDVMSAGQVEMKIDTYSRLLKRLSENISIPFKGEPLSGLQIMGVLETRALDFENIIILSMNDGVFPKQKVSSSFIPYNIRKGFGLPTYEHQDSIWAYHFYRLIHRASHASFLYDTRTTGLQTGEVSRFIYQLRYHYELPIEQKQVVYNVSSTKTPVLQIEKTEKIMGLLDAFRVGGDRDMTASLINTYLDCSLKFYFSAIENVSESEEVKESVESDVFGSILHKVLEVLYKPFHGKMITADILKSIQKDHDRLDEMIRFAFGKVFFKDKMPSTLTGQNYLIGEVIRKYVLKLLEQDVRLTPFRYIDSEKRMNDTFSLSNDTAIRMKGFIDRVDEVKEKLRIVDYKSGSGNTVFNTMESLFDKEDKDRPKAIMQVFLYSWMYGRLAEAQEREITPNLYYMRSIFSPSFSPIISQRVERGKVEPIEDIFQYTEAFENCLRVCLDEIFNKEIPFSQTPIMKACAYCFFKSICGK